LSCGIAREPAPLGQILVHFLSADVAGILRQSPWQNSTLCSILFKSAEASKHQANVSDLPKSIEVQISCLMFAILSKICAKGTGLVHLIEPDLGDVQSKQACSLGPMIDEC